jgi:hypothetical protein
MQAKRVCVCDGLLKIIHLNSCKIEKERYLDLKEEKKNFK